MGVSFGSVLSVQYVSVQLEFDYVWVKLMLLHTRPAEQLGCAYLASWRNNDYT